MEMRLLARLSLLAGLAALTLPGHASAGVETLVLHSAPITVTKYEVARGVQLAPSPKVDGYVVGMSAELVDILGNPVPAKDVMLHHVVFAKVGTPDYTCSRLVDYSGNDSPFPTERFYAEGEENFSLALPQGYGYQNRGTDLWGLLYMLMNHHPHSMVVQVRYTVQYVTNEPLTAVKPVWLDIKNCRADPVFNIPGTGGRGSVVTRTADFRMPESGRFVAGGGHLHGGGIALDVAAVGCGSIFTSYPTWGLVFPRPILHEPGPMEMTGFADPVGRPVRAGDVIRLTARYDNSKPHVRVMGIVMLFFAPGPTSDCRSYTSPVPAPSTADPVTIDLLKQPAGPVRRNLRSTVVGDYTFGAERVSLRRGARFTWNFRGGVEHDVTLASGPAGFASPSMRRGSYTYRFSRRGTYKLFCSLHPARMTQVVNVR
jgi:plastocyanin